MLSIRLKRMGKKKAPTYRIVVMDKRKAPRSNYIESLGFYNPRTKPKTIQLKKERIEHWLNIGAQPSTTVHNLFVNAKIIKKPKIKIAIKKKKKTAGETKPAEQPKGPESEKATKEEKTELTKEEPKKEEAKIKEQQEGKEEKMKTESSKTATAVGGVPPEAAKTELGTEKTEPETKPKGEKPKTEPKTEPEKSEKGKKVETKKEEPKTAIS